MLLNGHSTKCVIGFAALSFASIAMTQQVEKINADQAQAIRQKCNQAASIRYQDKLQQAIVTLFKEDVLHQNCIKLETQKLLRLTADEQHIIHRSSDQTFRYSSEDPLQLFEQGTTGTDTAMGLKKQSGYASQTGSQETESDALLNRVNGYKNVSGRN